VKRRLAVVLLAVLLQGCAIRSFMTPPLHTSPPSHPNETHVLAETQRFAGMLGIKVKGVITTKPHMVPASRPRFDGEMVPAAGRWVHGHIEYFRPVVRERSREYLTSLAAHEVSHAWRGDKHSDGKPAEDRADACARLLVAGEGCPR
jgi:hypothetical protein